MVDRENSSSLEVFRRARLKDARFLAKARAVASIAFGELNVGLVTLRPPVVQEPVLEGVYNPQYKVYDAENLYLKLLWRQKSGGKYTGKRFFEARQALENGIKEKPLGKRLPAQSEDYSKPPLYDQLSKATRKYSVRPDAVMQLLCSGITCFQDPAYPDAYIFALTPAIETDEYSALMTEKATAELALKSASRFVSELHNPQTNLVIPFMRVTGDHEAEQRGVFVKQLITENIFPVKLELDRVEFDSRH
jgi:hypothetical protein